MTKNSPYIEWAKTKSAAKYNLALSGVLTYPLNELDIPIEEVATAATSSYGYEPLIDALAAKFQVAPECVVHANGTSFANHLAMATILERGDEVLIEYPAYDPLLRVPEYLGAKINRFTRRFEDDFRIDLDEIKCHLTPQTKLIVITNLHNPSGVLTDNHTLQQIGELAESLGARVLVDEVYLEAMFERAQPTAFHLGNQFVVTSSLTKAYGLSGLRCGWILAERELAHRMWRLNDIFGVVPPHPAERLSVVALANLDKVIARAKTLLEPNRAALKQFLNSRQDLPCVQTEFGTTVFPRLLNDNVESFCAHLREKYETAVVPGKFFEMPEHFRIGICAEPEIVAEGLKRLGAALDELNR
ncbi:MAG: aminotransferase class I/II-fold pyridoxal phosphate-dependent enzyme [Acidobacteriota bacterium]